LIPRRPGLGTVLVSVLIGTTTGILLEHYRRHLREKDRKAGKLDEPRIGWRPLKG
jgi:hypothetical protein